VELVDTHCHLTVSPLADRVDDVLRRAREASVTRVIVPGYDLASFSQITALAARPGVFVAYGLHPWVATEPLDAERLAALLRDQRAVAVGEIGLDFVIDDPQRERQQQVLRAQLEVAVELGLPVLLHCRGAFEEMIAALRPFAPRLRGVVHAFSRGPELAARLCALGLHLAFGGAITRPRAERARGSARSASRDRILLETDAPSIGLEGIEPERVEPLHVAVIAESLAALRGEPLADVARMTTDNARALFAL
jgi:TatD DNase family protein